jgi:hypothetical protein
LNLAADVVPLEVEAVPLPTVYVSEGVAAAASVGSVAPHRRRMAAANGVRCILLATEVPFSGLFGFDFGFE